MIGKKIGLFFVYYFLASLVDQIALTLTGNTYISFIVAALVICISAYSLRGNQIYKANYGQEIRDEYNISFRNKFNRIVKSKEFITEMIIGAVACLLFALIPALACGISGAFIWLAYNRLLIFIYAGLFVIADFVIWLLAYRKHFRIKKY